MVKYDNNTSEMLMSCDEPACQQEAKFEGSFQDCIRQSKDKGWKARPASGGGLGWVHRCEQHAKSI